MKEMYFKYVTFRDKQEKDDETFDEEMGDTTLKQFIDKYFEKRLNERENKRDKEQEAHDISEELELARLTMRTNKYIVT